MNLLLVEPTEVVAEVCALTGRRADHLRAVIGAAIGSQVRAGIIGRGIGTAEVIADDGVTISLRVEITRPAPSPLPIELVLAIPRPKVLGRVLESVASFGVARLDLTNAWRVDKSYLGTPRLAPEAIGEALRVGAEQGATTHLPQVHVHARLMGLLDDRWPPGASTPTTRLIAHPGAPPIEHATPSSASAPTVLAIGPEGGWLPREVDTFVERGFVPVSIGAPILRVEAAIAAALGQLMLLARQRA